MVAASLPSVASVVSSFDAFRQKLYLRGVLGKKNDRAGDGRPYSMRKWTRWYVELRGPVLVFWNLLDSQLSAYLEDITAIVDGRVQPGSPEFERTVAHIKNIVVKPNFINITDAACSIVGKLKKRDSVWMLHSSGANRFYMQAVDDRAMNEWVRCLRLACFEAAKLYEYYSAALINERYANALVMQRMSAYNVQVRFSGTNEWIPCELAMSNSTPFQMTFCSQQERTQLAVLRNPRSAYAIYPDSLDSVNTAVIAKLEGDCDVDASLHPKIEDPDGEREEVVAPSRTHGSYALVIFQNPGEMGSALVETAARAKLYSMPKSFAPDVVPDREKLYLAPSDIADKSIEIMEPVTARRMLDNLASERCARLDSVDQSAGNSTSESTANMEPVSNTVTKMPWDSDGSDDDDFKPHAVASNGKSKPKAAPAAEQSEAEAQPQKRHFQFLRKNGKSKDSSSHAKSSDPAAAAQKDMKHLRRQSKVNSSATVNSTTTTNSTKESLRNSGSHSQNSSAPSLPTSLPGLATQSTFADEASEAIVNLKIMESPPPGAAATASEQPRRQLAESDTESDGDQPLGNIVSRAAQNMGMAHNGMQQQAPMSMYRASTAMPALGGFSQQQQQQQMMMMNMQQQPNMMQPMMPNTLSMYGGNPAMMQQQMYPQQPQMFGQDPMQMMGGQMMGGMPMPVQGPGSVRGRPTTYMDGGNMWGQQQQMQQPMGGMMDSIGGPLLTMEKKVDPIERPTGLVGAIATREQMKSEQKYRDASSLMRERQNRRNQAMGMANPVYGQMGGRMYGGPQQGWADDTMSMMSGMSGRAPYAQMAPSLSAEQLGHPAMRGTMYGNMQMPMQMNTMGMAGNDDDVALSTYAAGGRMSMAAGADVHPLRAAMQSGMSASSPHLAGQMNPYGMQQMQMMQGGMPMQQPGMIGMDQQRRMSMAGMGTMPRNSMMQAPASPGAAQINAVQSRHSLASSNSGSGASSDGSPLAMHHRVPASRWVKEPSSLRAQAAPRAADARSSTMPRQRGVTGGAANARGNIASVYGLPNRGSSTVRTQEPSSFFQTPGQSAGRYNGRYSSQSDISDESDSDDAQDSETSEGDGVMGPMSKELKQFFNVFADKCLDVKPYAWLDFDAAHGAYTAFCKRNGLRGNAVASSSQFRGLMEAAEWQLKSKPDGTKAYYNTCLLDALEWDEQHLRNKEGVYCYCGMDYNEGDPMLQCSDCNQLFHWDCVSCLKAKPLRGDIFYQFKCNVCNEGKGEEYEREVLSWVQVIYLVLYHLSKEDPKRSYFRWRENICQTISDNWAGLFPDKKKTATWQNTVAGCLSTHSALFKSGMEETQQSGNWTLHEVAAPTRDRFRGPTKTGGRQRAGQSRRRDGAEKEILEVLGEGQSKKRSGARHRVSFSDDEDDEDDRRRMRRAKRKRIDASKALAEDSELLQSVELFTQLQRQQQQQQQQSGADEAVKQEDGLGKHAFGLFST
ncbi:hypothetical protein LPJ79_000933 [Coemansia sp. RSA 1821]|nr:hypothetical protein LPJ79_000933 [Coemansia sp. RSA 1821]